MLTVRRARLKNMFQHRDLAVDLPPGMVGVTGPNGSGKSNFARAVLFGLSGSPGGGGARADAIGWCSSAEALVELCLGTPDGDAVLLRRASSSKQLLTVAGMEDPITKAGEIQAVVEGWLNGPVRLLESLPFVSQEDQRGLISGRHSERADDLVRLFRLETAAQLRAVVVVEASKVPTYPDVRVKLSEETARAAEVSVELAAALKALEDAETGRRSLLALKAGLQSVQGRKTTEDAAVVLAQLGKEASRLQTLVGAAPAPRAFSKDEVEAAMARRQTREDLAAMREREAKAPAYCDEEPCKLAIKAHRSAYEHAVRLAEGANLAQRAVEQGKCLICGGPCTDLCRERAEALESENSDVLEKLKQKAGSAESYLWDVHSRNNERKKLEDELARLEASLKGTDEVSDSKLLEAVEAAYLAAEVVAKAADLAVCREKIRVLQAEPVATAAEIARAKAALEQLVELEGLCSRLAIKAATLEAEQAGLAKSLLDLRERAKKHEQAAALMGSLDLVKKALHPDSLPKVVMRRRIEGLNNCMAKYLQMFEAPFGLRLDPETMDFRCAFPGKDDAPAGALSGGQKVVASLVFRFAFVELVGFGCGLWVLDEPTEFMDARNRQMLMDFLQRAAGHFRSRELTLLIPTHDEGLLSVCDMVISLGKESA